MTARRSQNISKCSHLKLAFGAWRKRVESQAGQGFRAAGKKWGNALLTFETRLAPRLRPL
jgi:hypothetical protein